MEFSKLIKQRRAVNFFDTDKDVSDEELRKLIDLASFAPSGFNMQALEFDCVAGQRRERASEKKLP